ncbi:uncharacterized protein LOC100905493 [Galendromus occidentalis]|uniref:cyclic pyranopterin monophosphate synthase n=1 Tax=Galendromus occidentalis TaxID=34638 RepID=A0AAJ6QTY4_9ACAR|nr:uncharacterized protein LOC100905493 [Galendromus occidentalis]
MLLSGSRRISCVFSELTRRASAFSGSQTLTHVNSAGEANQVDISAKGVTLRRAEASCRVHLPPNVFDLVKENRLQKGDVFSAIRLAGIQASKLTPHLIPLCHQISLEKTEIEVSLDAEKSCVLISSTAVCSGKTGVEMEALTACSVAALCLYDMCKAISQEIEIQDLKLNMKSGGRTNFDRGASSM